MDAAYYRQTAEYLISTHGITGADLWTRDVPSGGLPFGLQVSDKVWGLALDYAHNQDTEVMADLAKSTWGAHLWHAELWTQLLSNAERCQRNALLLATAVNIMTFVLDLVPAPAA